MRSISHENTSLIDSTVEYLRMRLNDQITLKLINDLKQFLNSRVGLSKLTYKSNSSSKTSKKRLQLPITNQKPLNSANILNYEFVKHLKRPSVKASQEKNIKEAIPKSQNQIDNIIQRNPHFVKNLLKSKIAGLGLKLKIKEINKSRKISMSPSQDMGKVTTTNCETYVPTESNCTNNHKSSLNACLNLKATKSRNLNRNFTYSETHNVENKKVLNVKSFTYIRKNSALKSEESKLKNSKLNSLKSNCTLELKPAEASKIKVRFPNANLNYKIKSKLQAAADQLKKTDKGEVNNLMLNKVKNCLGFDLQGLLNFSYDEFHNLTSKRLSNDKDA